MSVLRAWLRRHEYRDSMVLMYLSRELGQLPGVERAMAVMGTEANKGLLATVGLLAPEAEAAGPNDLVIALRAENEEGAARAADRIEELLAQRLAPEKPSEVFYRSLETAARALPGANLALISVPGRYAAREARRALDLGLHVFLFSDNVPLEAEIELKRLGRERGLLVMGPDCGTAIVGGVALGFANVVRRGPIGIVGASGTGIQEVCALLDRAGLGISHALGTGGRDLSAAVGGATTLQAIALLADDPATAVLVLISKFPSPEVAERVLERAAACRKPVVACLLGQPEGGQEGNLYRVGTLAEAAQLAADLAMQSDHAGEARPAATAREAAGLFTATAADRALAAAERAALAPDQCYVRGLFSGGSLCEEALVVWRDTLGPVWANAPLDPALRLLDPRQSREHTAVDLGDDFFTLGRPHPMLDPSARSERLLQEASDPSVAVVVLDVVLGYSAHPDMAGALAPAIAEARRRAEAAGRYLAVVARVCGTAGDPQGLTAQEEKLRAAGALLAPSNAAAAQLAALIASGKGGKANGS